MAEVVPIRESKTLAVRGVARDVEDDRFVSVVFTRRLSDDELRFFHEVCARTAPLMDIR